MKDPILTAPRYRPARELTLTKDFIKTVREQLPHLNYLTDKQLISAIKTFNTNVWKTVIEVRDGVELPEQLGHMFIATCQPPKRNPNFELIKKYKKPIQYRNWESDSFLAKIFYTTSGTSYKFMHHELWGFDADRTFTRTVGVEYPKRWKQYVQIDKNIKVKNIYLSNIHRMKKERENKNLDNYNEFDI